MNLLNFLIHNNSLEQDRKEKLGHCYIVLTAPVNFDKQWVKP